MRLILLGAVALLGAAAPAFAQGQCVDVCGTVCVKPISIPDRWDDVTPIPGYAGEIVGAKTAPDWRNNARYDQEGFIDTNSNGLWDAGESFTDGNGNGIHDAEAYDPATTGYNAGPTSLAPSGDLGAMLTLSNPSSALPGPGQYLPVRYPSGSYADEWSTCNATLVGPGYAFQIESSSMLGPTNQQMRDAIAQDPDAYWDPVTSSVQGSLFTLSPRVIFLPVHDPRIPIHSGSDQVFVTKVVAFFMDHMTGAAIVEGRFTRALIAGEQCSTGGSGFLVECPTPAHPTSWGRVKDLYR